MGSINKSLALNDRYMLKQCMKKKNMYVNMLVFLLSLLRKEYPLPKFIDNNGICQTSVFPKKNKSQFGENQNWTYKIENKHLLKQYLINIFEKCCK